MIAGLMPDIVDKTLCQLLHLTPSGRMAAHTLFGLAISAGVVALIWGKRAAWSWALGYLGHLVADAGGDVPWLYPFVHYDFPPSPSLWESLMNKLSHPLTLLPELFLCAWAGFAARNKSDVFSDGDARPKKTPFFAPAAPSETAAGDGKG